MCVYICIVYIYIVYIYIYICCTLCLWTVFLDLVMYFCGNRCAVNVLIGWQDTRPSWTNCLTRNWRQSCGWKVSALASLSKITLVHNGLGYNAAEVFFLLPIHTYIHIHIYMHMHHTYIIHTHTHTYTHTHIYTHTHTHLHVTYAQIPTYAPMFLIIPQCSCFAASFLFMRGMDCDLTRSDDLLFYQTLWSALYCGSPLMQIPIKNAFLTFFFNFWMLFIFERPNILILLNLLNSYIRRLLSNGFNMAAIGDSLMKSQTLSCTL